MIKKRYTISAFVFTILILICVKFTNQLITISASTKSTTIALNMTSTYLTKGESTTLKITGTPKKIIWTSTNKNIAVVTSAGKVTAVGYGNAYINATVNNKDYKCKITVVNPAKITFQPTYTTVFVNGDEISLNPVSNLYSASDIKKMGISYKVTGNTTVKINNTGMVTADSAGDFKVVASVHGKKIKTIDMKAVTYDGFVVPDLWLETNIEEYVGFAKDILPLMKDVEIISTNNEIAVAEKSYHIDLNSNYKRCEGIYVKGIKEGTCYIKVTVAGITKELKVVVGDGYEKLDPVGAVKSNDLSGYTGKALDTLTAVRKFLDDNNLFSSTLSDKEKVTLIQTYLNSTYSGKFVDDTYKDLISGVIMTGSGVCASYAETFSFLCDIIGIEVYYCIGSADNGSGYGFAGHAWNKAKIDGTWYYIDTYWNAGLKSFKYFLSEKLWADHRLIEEGYFFVIMNSGVPPYSNSLE
ncbi:hypothetical protein acsn021_06330 [Anaerocolumna cellulosilytica]|uniref:Uncharacterized protein n=1 Tax=Anaerocolumna cellulosilytica TaxID=433286 RepID=A0A6S6QR31_9FIRM|nr:Ig-like domain-containing protein [Anaerocolumna cellulosilytica]MBB5198087.1 transglutaminase/protease-like cytokinesis protein 3 [Anaerocolumna cellulosilytica]BCJ93064.1 hypothetical protein acsn021_06330 [Anaerocolumna cellulosilytica]